MKKDPDSNLDESNDKLEKLVAMARKDPAFFHKLVFEPESLFGKLNFLDRKDKGIVLGTNPRDLIGAILGSNVINVPVAACGTTCESSCKETCGKESCYGTCGKDSCQGTCGAKSCQTTCDSSCLSSTCSDSCTDTTSLIERPSLIGNVARVVLTLPPPTFRPFSRGPAKPKG